MAKYNITPAVIVAMYAYANVTPQIVDEIGANINMLISAYDEAHEELVTQHLYAYAELLQECKALMLTIAAGIEGETSELKKRTKKYETVINQKIR